MSLLKVDDCIREIYIDENSPLYQNLNNECFIDINNYPNPIVDHTTYDIGQKIFVIVGDIGNECGIQMAVQVNNKDIINSNKFWHCTDCFGDNSNYIYNKGINRLDCYNSGSNNERRSFTFYFQINSIDELIFGISEYSHYLTKQNYFYISPFDLNEQIDLLNISSLDILYAKLDNEIITPNYNYICYKLVFDQLFISKGKFIGINEEENDIELNETTCSRISQTKQLRYELSESEIETNGVHLRVKIGIYNNQNKKISDLEDFNFFICLNGYQFCDIETSMKCLNEGYYQLNTVFQKIFHSPNRKIVFL